MDLYLIRHPAVAIAPGICYGGSDVALLETPDVGAAQIADKLAALTGHSASTGQGAIMDLSTSPLKRCATVASHLAARPAVDARLAELDFGRWEGLAWDAIPREEIDAWAADILHGRSHGGESVQMLADRTASWLAKLDTAPTAASTAATTDAAIAATDAPDVASNIAQVAITHAGVIRVMTAQALQLPLLTCINWPIAMTGVCHLTRANAQTPWTLARWNR